MNRFLLTLLLAVFSLCPLLAEAQTRSLPSVPAFSSAAFPVLKAHRRHHHHRRHPRRHRHHRHHRRRHHTPPAQSSSQPQSAPRATAITR